VSDPRHVAAVKAYSNAMDRTLDAQVKWAAARQDADADRAALAKARSRWVPVLRAEGPLISMGAPEDDPASVRHLEAQTALHGSQTNHSFTAAIEDALRGDVAEEEKEEHAAWAEYNNVTYGMLQGDSPPAANLGGRPPPRPQSTTTRHGRRLATTALRSKLRVRASRV